MLVKAKQHIDKDRSVLRGYETVRKLVLEALSAVRGPNPRAADAYLERAINLIRMKEEAEYARGNDD